MEHATALLHGNCMLDIMISHASLIITIATKDEGPA
jgi:hypothetical protein